MKKISILGFGGHGRVLHDIATIIGYDVIEFYDDNKKDIEKQVVGDSNDLLSNVETGNNLVFGIGDNISRSIKVNEFLNKDFTFPSIIHPMTYIADDVQIGEGVVICAGVIIQTGCVINDFSIINTGATIDHDCILGSFSHICPGTHLAGGVSVGEKSFIGIGSSVSNNINIGSNVLIGAGSSVVNDINSNVKAFGVPAKEV